MGPNYVDGTGEEGTFHGTTRTGAATSSPSAMQRSFLSASFAGSQGGGAGATKCVRMPATHVGSFKCCLHSTKSQGHGQPHPSSPTSLAGGSTTPQQSSSSTRTNEAQWPQN